MSPPLAEELARLLCTAPSGYDVCSDPVRHDEDAKRLLADPLFLRLAARVVLEKGPKWGKPQSTYDYLRAVAEGGKT